MNFFKAKWRRPKHKGVSGNFSTLVIITGVVIGSYIMTGGGYPEILPVYPPNVMKGEPYAVQPEHSQEYGMTFRELKMRPLGRAQPTPILTFGPTEIPTLPPEEDPPPTTPDAVCDDQSIAFLVDVSGSMLNTFGGSETKIDRVKAGINAFSADLSDDAVVGIYSFSEPFDGVKGTGNGEADPSLVEPPASQKEPRERLPLSTYGKVKDTFSSVVNGLNPYPFAATYMKDGVQGAISWLQRSKPLYAGNTQNLIFISDGVPETDVRGPNDIEFGDNRAYSPVQDPTLNPNLGPVLKQNQVNVYSIAIYEGEEDAQMLQRLRPIMQGIASNTTGPFYSESLGAGNIESILTQIKESICGS